MSKNRDHFPAPWTVIEAVPGGRGTYIMAADGREVITSIERYLAHQIVAKVNADHLTCQSALRNSKTTCLAPAPERPSSTFAGYGLNAAMA